MVAQGRKAQAAVFERGALMYDPVRRKFGEFQDMAGPYALLRPVGGGCEWDVDPARIRPATPEERLSAGLKVANARSERGL